MLNEREMSTIFLLSAGEYLKQVQIKAYNLRGGTKDLSFRAQKILVITEATNIRI